MENKTSKEDNSDLTKKLKKFAEAFNNFDLGEIYRTIGDYNMALESYKKAAEVNHPTALNNIGVIYMNGLVGPKNYDLAIEYFKKALEGNNEEAFINLGKCYLYGTKEYDKAYETFMLATKISNIAGEAYNKIGTMFLWFLGEGNDKLALENLKIAYDLGYSDTYELGLMYLYNYSNLTNDIEEGIRLLDENALIRNDKDSSIELAYYLTKTNDNRATKYIDKCKNLGIIDIEERIQRKLNGEDINLYH